MPINQDHQAEREQQARELLGKHYECEDCWYSCPMSDEGCCDDRQPKKCNCGLDDKVNRLIALLASRDAAVLEEAVMAVQTEEELTGPMPEDVREALSNLSLEEQQRAAVRTTKKSIIKRLRQQAKENI